jgi:putative hydrolase of the HAD superfamily
MTESSSGAGVPWPKCDWLIFDAVGTLIHPTPSVAVAYHSTAARHGSLLTVNEIGDRFRRAFRQSELAIPDELASGCRWLSSDAIEVARWRWIVSEVVPDVADTERCFEELWDHFARPSSWSCFDDVQPTLLELQQTGYRLGIASNFDSRLHTVCEGHLPLSAIERRFVSSETGYRKPAPQFYATITSQCGCTADRILMIGDDPEHDVQGAITAGMQALLLDRHLTKPAGSSIGSLRQLFVDRTSTSSFT